MEVSCSSHQLAKEKNAGIKFGQRLVEDLGWVAQAVLGKMVEIVEQEFVRYLAENPRGYPTAIGV